MRFIDTGLDGPDESLERWLLPLLPDADLLAAQSGFFSLTGWNLVGGEIQKLLERGGQVHLVVGGRPEQSDPQGLQAALDLLDQYPDTTSLVAVNDIAAMHTAKAYYVRTAAGQEHGWVGSANLTGRGMKVNYQAGIQLGPEDDPKHARRVLESVTAWRTDVRPALRVDQRYIRELWPAARSAIFDTPPRPPRRMRDVLEGTLDVSEATDAAASRGSGFPTGLTDLDDLLFGLHPGQLTVVGGLEGMGKTALLLEFIRAATKAGTPAGYLTLQATVDEINIKLLAAATRVPIHHVRGALMTDDDWRAIAHGMGDISDWPIYVASHAALALDQLLLQIEDLAANGVRLVAIDMPTQITVPGADSREQELALISARLKAIALQLEIAVVAAWPLGNGPHQRSTKRPELSDLRGSSQIRTDADVVILIHRDDAFDFYPPIRPGEADIIVAKNRNGPAAAIVATFLPHFAKFLDADPDAST